MSLLFVHPSFWPSHSLYNVSFSVISRSIFSVVSIITQQGGIRSASAPLRTYLHGLAQQQGLATLCNYGGPPMTNEECKEVGKKVMTSFNLKNNHGDATSGGEKAVSWRQMKAVQSLKAHLGKYKTKNRIVPAISTGSNSEVVIQGVGALALCKEIPGTIKTGVKVMVEILEVDEKRGKVVVALHSNDD